MPKQVLIQEQLTRSVIGAFYRVYNTLDFGFLEHVYVLALERELRARGHEVQRELGVPVHYQGEPIAFQRLDMVIDNVLVVETKASLTLNPIARRQLYNYLHATKLEVGLLLHFGPKPKFYREICRNRETSSEGSAVSAKSS